jgi:hypothetical protein
LQCRFFHRGKKCRRRGNFYNCKIFVNEWKGMGGAQIWTACGCLRHGFGSGTGFLKPTISHDGKVHSNLDLSGTCGAALARGWVSETHCYSPKGKFFKFGFVGLFDICFLCTFLPPAGEKYQKRRRSRGNLRFPLKIPSLTWWRTRCLCTALIAPKVTRAKTAELLPSVATNSVAQRCRAVGRGFKTVGLS